MMYKVLIVEDDENMRFLYTKMKEWEECGFRIAATAENGKEALEKIEKQSFDMVLTDIRMPDMDGIALLKRIKEMEIPLVTVLVSSHDEFEYARQGILFGAFDFLVKPVRRQQLKEMLLRVKEVFQIDKERKGSVDFSDIVMEKLMFDKKDEFIRKVCTFCAENIEENVTMEQCAKEMGISKDYFGKLARAHFHVSFKEMMNQMKIEYAKKLMKEESLKAYEISQILGYASPDYFTKIFKQYTGKTPSQYRQNS
ncbi:response regulator transcription factor [Anaerostipes sp. MSJ-23]|uniref:response regulator transcription factor n=1 Tax=Anaerostipes sp. MSJ-23 TaxID=2841520 RepID=UPI001C0FDA82|nr:response regulator [Anaerostipes sp. MSJ-23]MBU5460362.1 response regulator [Anaerostipes sp. MSJ-23]